MKASARLAFGRPGLHFHCNRDKNLAEAKAKNKNKKGKWPGTMPGIAKAGSRSQK